MQCQLYIFGITKPVQRDGWWGGNEAVKVVCFRLSPPTMFIYNVSLHRLINKSLQLGTFPADWKKAIIVPIHKKDKSEISNYRPISLLSVTSKIIENNL